MLVQRTEAREDTLDFTGKPKTLITVIKKMDCTSYLLLITLTTYYKSGSFTQGGHKYYEKNKHMNDCLIKWYFCGKNKIAASIDHRYKNIVSELTYQVKDWNNSFWNRKRIYLLERCHPPWIVRILGLSTYDQASSWVWLNTHLIS